MKVVLLRDVARIGKKNSIVDVPDGYANNKLIPQGYAKPATKLVLIQKNNEKSQHELHQAKQKTDILETVTQLETNPLVVSMPANSQGHLFRAVHVSDIYSSLTDRGIQCIPETAIHLPKPVKELGLHQCQIVWYDINLTINVNVVQK